MIKHIIFGFYGTIVPYQGDLVLRDGFENMLSKFPDMSCVLSARNQREKVMEDLKTVGLEDRMIVHAIEDMRVYIDMGHFPKDLPFGEQEQFIIDGKQGNLEAEKYTYEPQVKQIAEDFEYPISKYGGFHSKITLISSHPHDISAGYWHTLCPILIPPFIDASDDFSFDKVSLNHFRLGFQRFKAEITRKYYINLSDTELNF